MDEGGAPEVEVICVVCTSVSDVVPESVVPESVVPGSGRILHVSFSRQRSQRGSLHQESSMAPRGLATYATPEGENEVSEHEH